LLIDYIDGKLNGADRRKVELELVNNPDAYTLYEQLKEVISVMDRAANLEPSRSLKTNFDNLLDKEIGNTKVKTVFFQPAVYRVAAAIAFLVVAGFGGYWLVQNQQLTQQQAQRLEEMEKEVRATK